MFAAWVDRRSSSRPDIFFNYSANGGAAWEALDLPVANTSNQEIEPFLFTSLSRVYVVLGSFGESDNRRIYITADEITPDGWDTAQAVEVGNAADAFFGRGIVVNDAASGDEDLRNHRLRNGLKSGFHVGVVGG